MDLARPAAVNKILLIYIIISNTGAVYVYLRDLNLLRYMLSCVENL